jgi:hypothetical protein
MGLKNDETAAEELKTVDSASTEEEIDDLDLETSGLGDDHVEESEDEGDAGLGDEGDVLDTDLSDETTHVDPKVQETINKRIGAVTRNMHDERREKESAQKENEDLRQKLAGYETEDPTPSGQLTGPPTLESCGWDAQKYQQGLVAWEVDKRLKVSNQRTQEDAIRREIKQVNDAYREKVKKANIKDFPEKMQALDRTVPLDIGLKMAIKEDDNGVKLAYHLAEHLDVAVDIQELYLENPQKAFVELGKISGRLSAKLPKETTNAPPPIKPKVKGGGSPKKTYSDMSMEAIEDMDIPND